MPGDADKTFQVGRPPSTGCRAAGRWAGSWWPPRERSWSPTAADRRVAAHGKHAVMAGWPIASEMMSGGVAMAAAATDKVLTRFPGPVRTSRGRAVSRCPMPRCRGAAFLGVLPDSKIQEHDFLCFSTASELFSCGDDGFPMCGDGFPCSDDGSAYSYDGFAATGGLLPPVRIGARGRENCRPTRHYVLSCPPTDAPSM
jgi:hypothetical protein